MAKKAKPKGPRGGSMSLISRRSPKPGKGGGKGSPGKGGSKGKAKMAFDAPRPRPPVGNLPPNQRLGRSPIPRPMPLPRPGPSPGGTPPPPGVRILPIGTAPIGRRPPGRGTPRPMPLPRPGPSPTPINKSKRPGYRV